MSTVSPRRHPHGAPVELEVEGRPLRISNADKVLWPATGFTKGDMLGYYRRVAPALLPHLAGHGVTMRRFPDGVDGLEWYQNVCRGGPDWLPVQRIVGRSGFVHQLPVVNDLPSLLWVVNLATIELHPLLATAAEPDRPPVVVFDLDPGPPAGLAECAAVALRLRALLARLGLAGWAKTSGSRGLHVYVPLARRVCFRDTKAFARWVARRLAREDPDGIVDQMPRARRAGKVFVDWGQNDPIKSMVAPYSLRATPRPSVSTPVTWDKVRQAVATGDPTGLTAGPAEVLERLAIKGDLFAPVLGD